MKIIFWLALLGIFYTYAGYPVAMWMLARLRPRRWKVAPITPSVSVVLAVHNGFELLPRKIRYLCDLDYPNIKEIFIVSDGSTDGTAELLRKQQHPRFKTIILKEHSGKAVALNAGMARATADIILFLDIRPEIAPGAIQQLVASFADPKIGCVSGELILHKGGHDAVTEALGGLYWRYEQWIRESEAAFDSPVGVVGAFYAIRRELAVPQPPGVILDDMFQPLSIIRQGFRSVLEPAAHVYDSMPDRVQGEFHRKVRTLAGNFQLFRLAPWALTPQNRVLFQLVSHKLMRLLAPYLVALLVVSTIVLSATSRVYLGLGMLEVVSFALAIAGLSLEIPVLDRIAALAGAVLVLNVAAVVGLYKFLVTRGPLWKIWNPNKPETMGPSPEIENPTKLTPGAAAEIGGSKGFYRHTESHQRFGA